MNEKPLIYTNKIQKYIRSLSSAKYRKKYNRYIIEGDKICNLFIEISSEQIENVLVTQAWMDANIDLSQKIHNRVIRIDEKDMKSISLLKTSSDIMIIAEKKVDDLKEIIKPNFRAVYLDDVQDPGNVGTIIRTASWFGFDAVIRSGGSADFYNPKVLQSTMGGHLYLKLVEMNIEAMKECAEDMVCYGADMDGQPYNGLSTLPNQLAIIIGNEGKGIRPNTRNHIDQFITIPGKDRIESLNASVAFGIIASTFSL